ncbi:MAG TPA: MBL fold metallo-hydrolase [bacterium]|nr:MBL fold metallo-hydrolase [bacterium]
MIVRCWGARGSIAVSGRDYLTYGGDTTCIEIRTKDDDIVIIDAGSGIRRLGNALIKEKRREFALIFTHAHWDHILGFPFFKPIYFSKTLITMFGCPFAKQSIKELISEPMKPPYFPIKFDQVQAQICVDEACTKPFRLKSLEIVPILLSHPNQGIGYKFIEDGKQFVFLTDNELSHVHPGGLTYEDYLAFSRGADLLIHDAEYTPEEYTRVKTWGHSTYVDAARLSIEAGVKRFGLFHHNQDRSDAAVDAIVGECRGMARTAKSDVEIFATAQDQEIRL